MKGELCWECGTVHDPTWLCPTLLHPSRPPKQPAPIPKPQPVMAPVPTGPKKRDRREYMRALHARKQAEKRRLAELALASGLQEPKPKTWKEVRASLRTIVNIKPQTTKPKKKARAQNVCPTCGQPTKEERAKYMREY
jgi:hypothetical protein